MHAVWDMPINISETIPIVQIALILLAWKIILLLIHNGLEEINTRQQNNMF